MDKSLASPETLLSGTWEERDIGRRLDGFWGRSEELSWSSKACETGSLEEQATWCWGELLFLFDDVTPEDRISEAAWYLIPHHQTGELSLDSPIKKKIYYYHIQHKLSSHSKLLTMLKGLSHLLENEGSVCCMVEQRDGFLASISSKLLLNNDGPLEMWASWRKHTTHTSWEWELIRTWSSLWTGTFLPTPGERPVGLLGGADPRRIFLWIFRRQEMSPVLLAVLKWKYVGNECVVKLIRNLRIQTSN